MISLPEGVCVHRVICYLRRSREDVEREKRTGEDTIAMQQAVMERVLHEYGLPHELAVEIGSGERIETRPIFQQVLRDLESGKYNCVAVKEISRLTRGDFRDYGYVYELIRKERIFILTPYRLYDPKNVNDLRQIRFEMFLSREEFETIRERMQGAKITYARAGRFMGSTPAYGYRTDPRTQRLCIFPPEAEVVRLIFARYLQAHGGRALGYRAIATYLTQCGIPSPSGRDTWSPATVKKILHNPVYIGEIRYNKQDAQDGIVVPDAHPAIVSHLEFEQVQQQKNSSTRPALRMDHPLHELTGIVRCGRCGKKMVRQTTHTAYQKKDGSSSVYEKEMLWCTTVSCTYVKYRAVESMLLAFLEQIPCPAYAQIPSFHQADSAPDGELPLLLRQQGELQKQLAKIYASFESGIYTLAEFQHRRELIREKLRNLKARIEAHSQQQATRQGAAKQTGTFQLPGSFANFAQAYRHLPSKERKNRLLHLLIESVHLQRLEKSRGQRSSPFTLQIAYRFQEIFPLRS